MSNNGLLSYFKKKSEDKPVPKIYAYMCVCRRARSEKGGCLWCPRHTCSCCPPRRKIAHVLSMVKHKLNDKAAVIAALKAASCKTDGSTAQLALAFFDLGAAEQAAHATSAYSDAWTAPA